ncbi:MAG: hypothetical protein JWM49_2522 [Microbacteriaceae bacterium]|nr:hypothetical protein [Microbacteriaceae bacterium]
MADHGTNSADWRTKAWMVDWVRKNPLIAYVKGPTKAAYVYAIANPSGNPYLRTAADNEWSDHLLSLTVYK